MSKRRRGPTLLEVLPADMRRGSSRRVGQAQSAPPPVTAGDYAPIETSRPWGWLSPGQVVRMPVGYILLAAAGVIIIAVAVFYIGYESGGRAERLRAEERYRTYGAPTTDPLVSGVVDPVTGVAPRTADRIPSTSDRADTRAATPREADRQASPQPRADSVPPPVQQPERVSGLNYWVLSSWPAAGSTPEQGDRLVRFLGDHGIPARVYRTRDHFEVWVLRGFSREELRTPEAVQFEQTLRRLGRIWKNEHGGWDDLATMYQKRY